MYLKNKCDKEIRDCGGGVCVCSQMLRSPTLPLPLQEQLCSSNPQKAQGLSLGSFQSPPASPPLHFPKASLNYLYLNYLGKFLMSENGSVEWTEEAEKE